MITQKYLAESILSFSVSSSSGNDRAIDKSEKSTRPFFKDVLSAAADRKSVSNSKSYSSNAKRTEDSGTNSETENRVKSYRELNVSRKKEDIAGESDSVDETEDPAQMDDGEESKPADDGKVEAVINCMSQVLDINPGELKELLESIGIKPEDLSGQSKISEVAGKLAEAAGLSKEEENVLAKFFGLSNILADKGFRNQNAVQVETGNADAGAEVQLAELEGKGIQMEDADLKAADELDRSAEFDKLLMQFKLKLQDLSQKFHRDPQGLMEEMTAKVNNLLSQSSIPEDAGIPNSDVDQQVAGTEEPGIGKAAVAEAKDSQDPGENESSDYFFSENSGNEALEAGQKTEDILSGSAELQTGYAAVSSLHKNDGPEKTFVSLKENVLPGKEILNQVVEKAKVLIGGEKAEMVMDLKPDNLGKLSLKVVTEHGMVVAKFVAESQQVKQVLEANMQTLKDSLEKQGLTVQGFSVSVRQDSSNGNSGSDGAEGWQQSGKRIWIFPGERVEIAGIPESLAKINPYDVTDSKINLTA